MRNPGYAALCVRSPAALSGTTISQNSRVPLPSPWKRRRCVVCEEFSRRIVSRSRITGHTSATVGSGQIKFDNFGGHWDDQNRRDRFLQAYAVKKV
ncbi:MAG: hypothetical protein ACLP9L_25590 [Thermoguttaceae bacterium]